MSEPPVAVNGRLLTEAQTACVRVAIESMLKALVDGPFAEDRYGREMSDLYCSRLREVRDLWTQSTRSR